MSKKTTIQNYDIASSADTLALSNEVAKFIQENNLYQNVQGKQFVNVEGWQYAGIRLGLVPVIEQLTDMSSNGEIKYQAQVRLTHVLTGEMLGAGYGICSNKEQGKKFYQEFAIASMAQTRAIGKAYRNMLAWIIKAAGYEATPAEEMEDAGSIANTPETAKSPAPAAPKAKTPANTQPPQPEAAEVPKTAPNGKPLATAAQKEQIIKLLGRECITQQEKTKVLLNINRFDQDRADKAIDRLKETIDQRQASATEEQLEIVEMLLEHELFTPDEQKAGKAHLQEKPLTFQEAAKLISQLEKRLEKRQPAKN